MLVLVVLAGTGAGYRVWDRGEIDLVAGGLAAVGVLALVAMRLARGDARAPQRSSVVVAQPRAVREELSELAAHIEALASRRGLPARPAQQSDGGRAVLVSVGRNQIAVIKALRSHFDLGLREAKDLTDQAKLGRRPLLPGGLPPAAAAQLARDVAAAGGQVEFE
jgi:ribosomal protein L7/L12